MTNVDPRLLEFIEEAKEGDEYWVESAKMNFAIRLNEICKESGISKTALAQKLGTSPAYVSKVFRGDTNFTIETMVKIARAVGANIEVTIVPQQTSVLKASSMTTAAPSSIALQIGRALASEVVATWPGVPHHVASRAGTADVFHGEFETLLLDQVRYANFRRSVAA